MDNKRDGLPTIGDEGDVLETKRSLAPDAVSIRPRSRRPLLVVLAGPSFGETFGLSEGDTVIGRSRDAHIRIEDESLSRRHVKILRAGDKVLIEDLGSVNGTAVNDAPVMARRPLTDGDRIAIGSTTVLKFTLSDDLDETFQRRMFVRVLGVAALALRRGGGAPKGAWP